MLRNTLLGLVACVGLGLPAAAQTVDELIAKNVEARGGLDKLKAVQAIRFTGKMTVGPGMEAPAVYEIKRPNKTRLEFTVQGLTGVQAFDGKEGWQIMPFQGNTNPEPMSSEESKVAEEESDIDGPLVDYAKKGHKVESLGKEKVEGTDAYKLQVTMKSGSVQTIFLDAESYLEIKTETKRTIRGTEQEGEQVLGDYKEVGGLLFAHAMEMGPKGRPERQKITLDKIELNPALEDARFSMPKKDEPAKQD